jgi:hypothetical protein
LLGLDLVDLDPHGHAPAQAGIAAVRGDIGGIINIFILFGGQQVDLFYPAL